MTGLYSLRMVSGGTCIAKHCIMLGFFQEEVVLPARRISKSRDATPAASDSDEGPDAAASEDGKEEGAAGNKGKLRKAAPDQQQDSGPAKKRRKRSSSKTPEASNSGQAPADPNGEASH